LLQSKRDRKELLKRKSAEKKQCLLQGLKRNKDRKTC
jgi:hypothetical protein